MKFEEIVAAGFGAEVYGGKPASAAARAAAAAAAASPEHKHAGDDEEMAPAHPLAAGGVVDYDARGGVLRRLGGDGAPLSDAEELAAIMKLVESAPEVAEVNSASVRVLLAKFCKAAGRNLEMRAKHADEPERFMESELALDEAINALQGMAAAAGTYGFLLEATPTGDTPLETLCNLIIQSVSQRALRLLAPQRNLSARVASFRCSMIRCHAVHVSVCCVRCV